MLRRVLVSGLVAAFASFSAYAENTAVNEDELASEEVALEFDDSEGEETDKIERFALVCLYVDSNVNLSHVNYSIKWGNGPWKQNNVRRGSFRYHSWRYSNPGSPNSPRLQIRFDSDLQGVHTVSYRLEKYAVPEENCNRFGKKYRFVRDSGSSRYIDLVTLN